jgi:hypothetical protein
MIQHIGDIDSFITQYKGYENLAVQAGMGRTCLGVIKEACYHSNNLKEYKGAFSKIKNQEWMNYISVSTSVGLRWKILKFFVQFNIPSMVYFFTKAHLKISKLRLKKRG